MATFEDWEQIARRRIALRARGGPKRSIEWDGDDPESLFEVLAFDCARGAALALDIGCGEGHLAGKLAQMAGCVVGVDAAATALDAAVSSPRPNVALVQADARRLPFGEEVFDLVTSRRGPASDDDAAIAEARRVMKPGAHLVALASGESHRVETQEVFGRGIHWPPGEPSRFLVPRRMEQAGLRLSYFAECYATSYYPDVEAFVEHLQTLPTIPDFDPTLDAALLREARRKLTTARGIRDTEHMAVFVAVKPR